jgi:hypothetical protein
MDSTMQHAAGVPLLVLLCMLPHLCGPSFQSLPGCQLRSLFYVACDKHAARQEACQPCCKHSVLLRRTTSITSTYRLLTFLSCCSMLLLQVPGGCPAPGRAAAAACPQDLSL